MEEEQGRARAWVRGAGRPACTRRKGERGTTYAAGFRVEKGTGQAAHGAVPPRLGAVKDARLAVLRVGGVGREGC